MSVRLLRPAVLALLVSLAPAALAQDGDEPSIASVKLVVPPGEDAPALTALLGLHAGDKLSPRALRRSVQLLYQLGRFSNVVVRELPADPGEPVPLVVECLARRVIREVRFTGAGRLGDERVRRAANLPVDEEFYPERLEAAVQGVKEAYRRLGWRDAEVTAHTSGERAVSVELAVKEGAPTRVEQVALAGRPALPVAQLLAPAKTRPGAVLDLDRLDEDVRAIRAEYRRRGYYRARVSQPEVKVEGGRARVTIPVDSGPQIAFRFLGNEAFGDAELRAALGYDGDGPLDDGAVDAAADALKSFYAARGFADARVQPREIADPGGRRAAVVFHVDEGRRYRVREVRFSGNAFHDSAWLRARLDEYLLDQAPAEPQMAPEEFDRLDALMAGRHAGGRLAPLDPREIYEPEQWDRALDRVVELYKGAGFLEASHGEPRVTLDASGGAAAVEVPVVEGPRTFVESVAFEGNKAVSLPELVRVARFSPNEPLSLYDVEETRIALVNHYASLGFLYARVADAEELSADRRQASVTFRIEEGPQVRVARIVITGNKRTREDVVRAALAVREGDVYDPERVGRSQANLLNLGVFRAVAIHVNDPEVPEASKDLWVECSERPWQVVGLSGGASIADGPRLGVEFQKPNLGGRALDFTGHGKVNYPLSLFRPDLARLTPPQRFEWRVDGGFHYPHIYPLTLPLGARFDVITERLHRLAYYLSRTSGVLGADLAATARVTLSMQYELETDYIQKGTLLAIPLTRADVERLRFPEGQTILQSVRPVVALDYRDNSANPHRGWFGSASADLSHSIGNSRDRYLFGYLRGSESFTFMLKLAGTVSTYLPVGRTVLAFEARGGRVFPLDPRSSTIGPKRFFLGGAATMRGYQEDEMIPEDRRAALIAERGLCASWLDQDIVCTPAALQMQSNQPLSSEGGEVFALVKAEWRFPIRGSVEGGLFVDAGNLWLDPTAATLTQIRANFGAGVRFVTPVGPASFDVGVNPQADDRLNERPYALHFSIGLF